MNSMDHSRVVNGGKVASICNFVPLMICHEIFSLLVKEEKEKVGDNYLKRTCFCCIFNFIILQ